MESIPRIRLTMAMSSVFCTTCAPVAIGTGGAGAIVVVVTMVCRPLRNCCRNYQ